MRTTLLTITVAAALTIITSAHAATNSWKTKARQVIYGVFPRATRDAAFRVVGCETGYTYLPWAYNSSSGASGYFQILQGNAGRVLHYLGGTITIPSGKALFNPWVNARVALFLSRGGTDWHEWSCQP